MSITTDLVRALYGAASADYERRTQDEPEHCDCCGLAPRRRLEQFDDSGDWLCECCMTDAVNELEAAVNDRVASTLWEVVS